MSYSSQEQETTCVYNHESKEWIVYSCVRRHMTKLSKIADPFWKEEEPDSKGDMRMIAGKWRLKMSQVRFAKMLAAADVETRRNRLANRRIESESVSRLAE